MQENQLLDRDALRRHAENIKADEYVAWLCWINGGWLTPGHGNLGLFEYAIRNMPPGGAMVEIGSFLGLSTNVLAYLAHKHGRTERFFCCDPWDFESTQELLSGYFDASTETFRNYCIRVFKLNMQMFSKGIEPYAVEAYSSDFLARWDGGEQVIDVFGRSVELGGAISFAYIDGAHTYEAAKADFDGLDPHLLPGGLILFDDSLDVSHPGAFRVANEVKTHPDYQVVCSAPNQMFRKL